MFKALKDQPTCQEIKKKNVWITRHNWEENTTETSDNSHWSQSYVFMFILTFFHESQAPMNQCTLQFPCQHTCNLSSSSLKLRLFFFRIVKSIKTFGGDILVDVTGICQLEKMNIIWFVGQDFTGVKQDWLFDRRLLFIVKLLFSHFSLCAQAQCGNYSFTGAAGWSLCHSLFLALYQTFNYLMNVAACLLTPGL